MFVCIRACECGALYEAVISSVLAALKQSDNPCIVNPRTAAQAVSAHTDSTQQCTQQHIDTTCGKFFYKAKQFLNAFYLQRICHGDLSLLQVHSMCAHSPEIKLYHRIRSMNVLFYFQEINMPSVAVRHVL